MILCGLPICITEDESMLLSVIIPVYNEATTIRDVLQRVAHTPFAKEIIVVDDCSTDGTRAVLTALDTKQTSLGFGSDEAPCTVKVRFHTRNQGKGAAIRTALSAVSGDIVL